MLTAQELMTPTPATVRPTATVREAVEVLQNLDIRHLPVVDEAGSLLGMLSDRDIRALEVPWFIGEEHTGSERRALTAAVSAIMSSDVVTVSAETEANEITSLLLQHNVGAVPVTDHDGTLVGIVSYVDLLKRLTFD